MIMEFTFKHTHDSHKMEIPDLIDEDFMHTQTLFIPQSQSQKYHLQHIQYYKNGELHNLTSP